LGKVPNAKVGLPGAHRRCLAKIAKTICLPLEVYCMAAAMVPSRVHKISM